MRRPFLVAACISLALHALLFFAFPPLPRSEPGRPSPPLKLRLSRRPSPATGSGSSGDAPALKQAAASSPAPPEPRPSPAPPPPREKAEPAAPPSSEAAPRPAEGVPQDYADAAAEERSAEPAAGPAPGGETPGGATPGAEPGPPLLDPADAIAGRLKAYVEAEKVYPEAARRRGVEGVVRIAVIVAPDGRLRSIRRAASSGSSLLDQAALELLRSAFPLGEGAGRELELVLAVRYELRARE